MTSIAQWALLLHNIYKKSPYLRAVIARAGPEKIVGLSVHDVWTDLSEVQASQTPAKYFPVYLSKSVIINSCRSTSYNNELSSYSFICFQLVQCRYMSFFMIAGCSLFWRHCQKRKRTTLPNMHGSSTLLRPDHPKNLEGIYR